MLDIQRKAILSLSVTDDLGERLVCYNGICELDCEKAEAVLEMVVEITEALNRDSIRDVTMVWNILERNGHIDI